MAFWTENNFEPKRAFRFKLNLAFAEGQESIPYFYLKTATKPTFEVTNIQHKFGGREFNFPGSVKWNEVKLEFVDDIQNTVLSKITNVIRNSGYADIIAGAASNISADGKLAFLSKKGMSNTLTTSGNAQASVNGTPVSFDIEQLNAEGLVVERWSLYNPIITKLEQDILDYSKEDLSVYALSVKYDWASFDDSLG